MTTLRRPAPLAALMSDRMALISTITLLVLIVASVVVPFLFPVLGKQDLSARLLPPAWLSEDGQGLMGTDQLGRDVSYRAILGVRTSVVVSVTAVALSFAIGSALGMLAGIRRGRAESVVVLFSDIQLSFPATLIALVMVTAIGQGEGPIILILGLSYWMIFARMARQSTLTVRSREFVQAATVLGGSTRHIIGRHIFWNVLPTLVGVAAIEFSRIMLAEAGLSYLGFGIQPPGVSLGMVLADGRQYLGEQWWISTLAGVVLTILVLSVTLAGKWVHRYLDPMGKVRMVGQ